MKSEIYYRSKHGVAAVQLILTIQSKEKRSLTRKTFQEIQESISTPKRCELNTYIQKKNKIPRKTATKRHETRVLTCSFSLNPEFSQKNRQPSCINYHLSNGVPTPLVSEYTFISHAESFSTGINDYKYKLVPPVGYNVERDLLSESFYKCFSTS